MSHSSKNQSEREQVLGIMYLMEDLRKCVTRKIKWREDSTIRVGKRVTHQCAVITNERRKRGVICVNARKNLSPQF